MKNKIPKSHTIETNKLLLRIASVDDIPFVFSATKYKGFNDGMLWDPPVNQGELLKPHEQVSKEWDEGLSFSFSIINKQQNYLVGRISIRKGKEDNCWNIGFWTHPEHQNKGYMTEATKAMIRFGFVTLGAEKIIACHALWNKASEKVLMKNGMVFTKQIENGFQKHGEWVKENQLEIKKSDWKE